MKGGEFMKNKIGVFLFVGLIFSFGFVYASDTNGMMQVSANVLETSIGIDVPDMVSFGDIASGYLSDRRDIEIDNIGTVDLRVTPQLEVNTSEESEEVFKNIAFRAVLDDPLIKIGTYSLEILKPTLVGGIKTEKVYMYLDLTKYEGDVNSERNANVIFWATEI
jgi:hypothetical protein